MHQSLSDRTRTAADIHKDITEWKGARVSVWTVKRKLRQFGLYGKLPHKKLLISLKNRIRRLSLARHRVDWTVQDWEKVLMKPKLIGSHQMENHISEDIKVKNLIHSLSRVKCRLEEVQYPCGVLFNMMILASLSEYTTHLTLKNT